MTHEAKTFAITDPRTFDGDPYEVSARACAQAEGMAKLLALALEGATVMARNAEMTRNDDLNGDPNAKAWEDNVFGRKFAQLHAKAKDIQFELEKLGPAVSWNPKNPPKA